PLALPSLPTRRSSDLALARAAGSPGPRGYAACRRMTEDNLQPQPIRHGAAKPRAGLGGGAEVEVGLDQFGLHQQPLAVGVGHHVDRKSTRLNSSHVKI